jgi:hypothetical protein
MSFYSVPREAPALLALVVLGLPIPRVQAQFGQQGPKLVGTGAVGTADQGGSVAVSGDGNTAIEGGGGDNNGTGAVWVFARSDGVWTQQGPKLLGTGAVGIADQGASVAVSGDGNTAISGGYQDNAFRGAVWVFTRSGGVWTQQGPKLVGSGAVGSAGQGGSVSVSEDGNTAIVGGAFDNNFIGAAWVFTRSGGVWTQQGPKLVGTGVAGIAPQQGISVSVSGDGNTAIVGAAGDNMNTGAAWAFTRSGGVWTQQGPKLVGTGAVGQTNQGQSVSVSGDGTTAIVGGPVDNKSTGAIWVFARSGGVWTQQGPKLVGTGAVGSAGQGFSAAVSGNGNTAIVGGQLDNNFTGAAWVFTRSGGVWTQQGTKLVGTGAVGKAGQGVSVSVSADSSTAIVGGPGDNSFKGAAWVFQSPWKRLTNMYPGSGAGPCLVLTNGDVACNNSQSNSDLLYRLTPDHTGSYVNGTWSPMPNMPHINNMPYQPVFYASAVLPNGQLIIQGGEYLNGSQMPVWTNEGAVFDPAANGGVGAWTPVTCTVIPPGSLGDSQSVIFPDGTFMIANIDNAKVATVAPGTDLTKCGNNCYTLLSPMGKDVHDNNDEEGWTLLPNGDILTVDAIASPNTQTYNKKANAWTAAGTTGNPACNLYDPTNQELGPQVLRPDGTVVAFGAGIAAGHEGACTAVYSGAQTWMLGPDFPKGLDVSDGPASLLLDGNVLVMAGPGFKNKGSRFFEWDGTNLTEVPGPPNAPGDPSFVGHMVILPTGEVLFTDFSNDVEVYTAGGKYLPAWAPTIKPGSYPNPIIAGSKNNPIAGTQFNGLSQGAAYGDDNQSATNYPLVRFTQLLSSSSSPVNVRYGTTHNHSTMAVATGATPVSTQFDVPADLTAPAIYCLQVVANGIPSACAYVAVLP